MQASDKPAVMHILRNTPEFLPFEVVVAEELIDAYLESPGGTGYHILVAETDGQVRGYVCYGPTPLTIGTWDIYWIAVDRAKRGTGVGSDLIKEMENRIKADEGRLAVVETSSKPDYNNTRQFFASRSYTEITRMPDFYNVGDDKVILVKRLR
jgi:ribosomal protein S18 acetylase RimI-like enzyme